jgi:hypothetical protein
VKNLVIKSSAGEVRATLIHCFDRPASLDAGENQGKLTVHNLVLAAFAGHSKITRVAYICTSGGVPMFVIECAGRWFDVQQSPVEISS